MDKAKLNERFPKKRKKRGVVVLTEEVKLLFYDISQQ